MKQTTTRMILPAVLLAPASGFVVRRAEPASAYPVSKVVELLRSMKDDLQKEADADEEVYEKLACWCQTNDKAKTKAIEDAEAHLANLEATINKMAALGQTLRVEIEGLEKEIAGNVKSLEEATALRKKQKADFIAEEKEMVQSIQALNAAVTVLAKHHEGSSFLESGAPADFRNTILSDLHREGSRLQGVITPKQRRLLSSFLSNVGADKPAGYGQAYSAQSGEIFGILKQMKETFENDLSSSQKEEVLAQKAYDDLKVAKEEQISTGQAALQDKKNQVAKADETLVQAKEDRVDTQASLSADEQFLLELKQKCSMTDDEWQERQKLRLEEMKAVSEAIAKLSSDDARDLFSKTLNPNKAFIQLHSSKDSDRRELAAAVLEHVATQHNSPKLSALASSVKLDAFTRVKQAIDDMVAELLKEKEDEIKHKDFCIEGLNTNEKSTAKELHTKKNLESKVAGLEMDIEELNTTINTLNTELADLDVQRQRASEDRELEKKEFDAVLADQKKAEGLLNEALDVMKSVYENRNTFLLQESRGAQTPVTPEPKGFSTYAKNGQSPGVLALLEHIIQNCQALQADAIKAEEAAKDAYMAFVNEVQKSKQAKQDAIVDRTSEMSQAEKDLIQAKSELDGTITTLETLSKGAADLHGSCDYIIKNFDVRQEARDQEVEALRQAKSYLSGMQ